MSQPHNLSDTSGRNIDEFIRRFDAYLDEIREEKESHFEELRSLITGTDTPVWQFITAQIAIMRRTYNLEILEEARSYLNSSS